MIQVSPARKRGKSVFSPTVPNAILLLTLDCATTLTREDLKHTRRRTYTTIFTQTLSCLGSETPLPTYKHTHTHTNIHRHAPPLSHTQRPGLSQSLFLLDFMGTLKFSPGRQYRHNNQSAPSEQWLPSSRWSG